MGLFSESEEEKQTAILREEQQRNALKEAYEQQQIFADIKKDDEKDNLYILLDNSNMLKEIELHLRGYSPKKDTNSGSTVWEKKYKAVMNDEGVQAVMQELHSRVGKNAILSNIPQEKAGQIAFQCFSVLSRLFMAYSKKFDLDNVKRTNVAYQVSDMIYFSLTRGIGGIERENAYNNRKTIEHRQPDINQKTKSGIGAFFG